MILTLKKGDILQALGYNCMYEDMYIKMFRVLVDNLIIETPEGSEMGIKDSTLMTLVDFESIEQIKPSSIITVHPNTEDRFEEGWISRFDIEL